MADHDVSNHPDNVELHSLPEDSPEDGTVAMETAKIRLRQGMDKGLWSAHAMFHEGERATEISDAVRKRR